MNPYHCISVFSNENKMIISHVNYTNMSLVNDIRGILHIGLNRQIACESHTDFLCRTFMLGWTGFYCKQKCQRERRTFSKTTTTSFALH